MLASLYQGLCPGPLFRPPEQRACDADRDTAVDILCAAAADGRLTMTELDERVRSALTARTLTQLARLIADLIGPRATAALPGPPPAPAAPGDRWTIPPQIHDREPSELKEMRIARADIDRRQKAAFPREWP
jgi:hypothetical protein